MKYETKVKNFIKAGFSMYGQGNFDLSIKEMATILELIEKEDFKKLNQFYNDLSEIRL